MNPFPPTLPFSRGKALWLARFGPQSRWVIAFVAACVGIVVSVVALIWAVSRFVDLRSIGLSGSALAGLSIGIVVSTGLGAALMGLVFQSDRNGQDETVYRASATAIPPSAPPSPTTPTGR